MRQVRLALPWRACRIPSLAVMRPSGVLPLLELHPAYLRVSPTTLTLDVIISSTPRLLPAAGHPPPHPQKDMSSCGQQEGLCRAAPPTKTPRLSQRCCQHGEGHTSRARCHRDKGHDRNCAELGKLVADQFVVVRAVHEERSRFLLRRLGAPCMLTVAK